MHASCDGLDALEPRYIATSGHAFPTTFFSHSNYNVETDALTLWLGSKTNSLLDL